MVLMTDTYRGAPWWLLAAASAVTFIVGTGIGYTVAPAPAASVVTVPSPSPVYLTPPKVAAATTAPAPKPSPVPVTITDEGVLLVGTDVKAGTYRTTVPADSNNCYYARLRDLKNNVDSIVANGNFNPGDKVTVTIARSDKAFEVNGCGTWKRVS